MIQRIERVRGTQLSLVGGQLLLQEKSKSIPLVKVQDCLAARPAPELDRFYVLVFQAAGREILKAGALPVTLSLAGGRKRAAARRRRADSASVPTP